MVLKVTNKVLKEFVLKVILIFGLFLMSYSAYSVDIQHFKRTNSFGFENLESARLDDSLYPNDYRFLFNLGLSFVEEPLTVKTSDNSEQSAVAINDFLSVHFGLGFYLTERLWVGATSSYVFADNNHSFGSTVNGKDWSFTKEEDSSGLEDVSIEASYAIIKKNRWGLTLIPELFIPTGDKDKFIGDGGIGYGLTLAYEKRFDAWQLAMNLGYRYSPEGNLDDGLALDYRNRINTSLGAIFRLYKKHIFLNVEARKIWTLPFNSDQNPNEGYLGLRGRLTRSLAVFGGASIGNFDSADGNSWRYSGGFKWYFANNKREETKQKRRVIKKKKQIKHVVEKEEPIAPVIVEKKEPTTPVLVSNCNLMEDIGSNNKAIILFARNGSQGYQKSVKSFDDVSRIIVKNRARIKSIEVSGHTSSLGDASYNLNLSKKRANIAVNNLVKNGVDRSLIMAEGYGEDHLRNTGKSEKSHAMNRRTEVKINLTDEFSSNCK